MVQRDDTELFFEFDTTTRRLQIGAEGAPRGNLGEFHAHWLTADTVAWKIDLAGVNHFRLHFAGDGRLTVDRQGLGGTGIRLRIDEDGFPEALRDRWPHLASFTVLKLKPEDRRFVRAALKGQVAVAAYGGSGTLLDATGLQIAGVLDDLYTYDGPLGVSLAGDLPTLTVWAPTARSVRLHRFADAEAATQATVQPMRMDPDTGVWSITGRPDWLNQFYLFEVEVIRPVERRVVTSLVTDPYSLSLSMNSRRSQIIDLGAPSLTPAGWAELVKPPLAAPEESVIYELHVRDFSALDETVPADLRGTFLAFTMPESSGMRHLTALADAGLTHVHLLPVFDIATIDEEKRGWIAPDYQLLRALPPDGPDQQALLEPLRGRDGYNWGYDPYHFNVPEGSYSTDPDGATRVLEFRRLVQALNQTGLRVIIDVVFNHTSASGLDEKSVLDKIVPGYYHRLSATGAVERSTCCANTATEHNMMRKLMVDSVRLWATAYKVDGFRFDLMGHHMVEDMQAVRQALNELTLAEDGVDGPAIFVYGEGWNFGEVADNARGRNATQLNTAGLGLGTFNDRLRDAVRGGRPFSGYLEQGFITGLFTDSNEVESRPPGLQRATLTLLADQIRVGLAGNLAGYRFIDRTGRVASGADIQYGSAPTGYTSDPEENIVYVEAHDNETLFDAIQAKAPVAASLAERIRMHNLGLSLVMFSQGVPFFHAGTDMLRSKSFDRDSFDSGDWFNRLDFSYADHVFGSGLPPAGKNQDKWPIMQPLLARSDLKPSPDDIRGAVDNFRALLQIRRSSPLFRLREAGAVQARLTFFNTGPDQIPGLIVMGLSDVGQAEDLDPTHDYLLILFNAGATAQSIAVPQLQQAPFELHPVLRAGRDELVRTATYDPLDGVFTVPARTTVVYVAAQDSLPPAGRSQVLAAKPRRRP